MRAITPILELGVGWNPELDAIDNVFLVGSVMGLTLAEIRARLDAILAFAELERFANLKLKHYSSGMAARLAYATAFEAVREVLVLDEIFAVGDAGFKAKCEERYRAAACGRSHGAARQPRPARRFGVLRPACCSTEAALPAREAAATSSVDICAR